MTLTFPVYTRADGSPGWCDSCDDAQHSYGEPVCGDHLGDWLRARRTALGLSQATLAELVGVDKQTIWRYEVGRQDVPRWMLLALEALEHRQRA